MGRGHAGGTGRRDRGAVLPATYQLYATSIAEDAIITVKGRVDRRDDVPKLIAMDVTVPDMTVATAALSWSRCR